MGFTISSNLDGYCLAVPNDDTTNGVDLILEFCDSSNSQSWLIDENRRFVRPSLNYKKCIQVQGGVYSNGSPIEVQDCVTSNTAQQWNFLDDGTIQSVGNPSYCWDGNGFL